MTCTDGEHQQPLQAAYRDRIIDVTTWYLNIFVVTRICFSPWHRSWIWQFCFAFRALSWINENLVLIRKTRRRMIWGGTKPPRLLKEDVIMYAASLIAWFTICCSTYFVFLFYLIRMLLDQSSPTANSAFFSTPKRLRKSQPPWWLQTSDDWWQIISRGESKSLECNLCKVLCVYLIFEKNALLLSYIFHS